MREVVKSVFPGLSSQRCAFALVNGFGGREWRAPLQRRAPSRRCLVLRPCDLADWPQKEVAVLPEFSSDFREPLTAPQHPFPVML